MLVRQDIMSNAAFFNNVLAVSDISTGESSETLILFRNNVSQETLQEFLE